MTNRIVPTAVRGLVLAAGLALVPVCISAVEPSFVEFESGPVRPLALSPDGTKLFAVNTPDNQLEIFDVSPAGIVHSGSVQVGMEPVALAVRSNTEVWVVNHLSDSVSVVDLAASPPEVSRTLIVGDEPRDIVFAGTGGTRAFISTAHRGQQRSDPSISPAVTGSGSPQLTTEGIGRADVWVFDATNLGTTPGGTPLRILTFFADTPRALAKSADGNTVYVAAFQSGNQTTSILEQSVCDGFDAAPPCSIGGATAPGGVPGPDDDASGEPAPEVGVIVKFDPASSEWRDVRGRNWSPLVRLDLPDNDVFAFNANTFTAGTVFSHVGTILFNMVVNPVSGKLYVTNTESRNERRFEGPGRHGGSTVQGHLSETRVSVLDPATGAVDPQHLNQHIDYSHLHTDVPDGVDTDARFHSLATPLQAVVSADGSKVYVAAFGSAKIGVFDASALEDPAFESHFDPTSASAQYIATGGGPAGLVLDEPNNRLFVLTRFDDSVSVIHLPSRETLQTVAMHNPEPASVVQGRPFLYDAFSTSGNGEASCASCHIFGDFDSVAWDLGNPDEAVTSNPQPVFPGAIAGPSQPFHPMKGPMTTQTLRGLATHGGMHWRGDRTNGFFGVDDCSDPVGTPCNEPLSFENFIVAFEGLLGHDGLIPTADMQKFTDFMLQVFLPPNPVRALSNTLTTAQQAGATKFLAANTDANQAACNDCHKLDPLNGMFGTNGDQAFEGEPQTAKVAHLRNAYQKVGMFGISAAGAPALGPQVRGFGYLHDGAIDTVFDFLAAPNFVLTNTEQSNLEQYVLAFDTDLAPIVGQQVTLRAGATTATNQRVDLLIARAGVAFGSFMLGGSVTECDVIAKGGVGTKRRGWVLDPVAALFHDDVGGTITPTALRALANTEGPLTFTAVPPGSGTRMGIDRDLDTVLDGNDNCPDVPNLDQLDSDANGVGDACQVIPEPEQVLMLVAGALQLAWIDRRRARRVR